MNINKENINTINWALVTIDDLRCITDDKFKSLVLSKYHNWLKEEREKDKMRFKE